MNNNYIEVPIIVLADSTRSVDYEAMGIPSLAPETNVEMGMINTRHIVAFWPESDSQTGVSTVSDTFVVDIPYHQFKSEALK